MNWPRFHARRMSASTTRLSGNSDSLMSWEMPCGNLRVTEMSSPVRILTRSPHDRHVCDRGCIGRSPTRLQYIAVSTVRLEYADTHRRMSGRAREQPATMQSCGTEGERRSLSGWSECRTCVHPRCRLSADDPQVAPGSSTRTREGACTTVNLV